MSDTILLFKDDADRAIACVGSIALLAKAYIKKCDSQGIQTEDSMAKFRDDLKLIHQVLTHGYIPTTCDGIYDDM